MLKTLLYLIKMLYEKIDLSLYDPFTIERYFKKKGYKVGINNRIFITDLAGEPYLVRIGNHCTITEGVRFITHDGGAWIFRHEFPDLNVFGKIDIKDNCFIGVNSIILPGVTIGPKSVVGAGSVVTKDVLPDTVVAGVPAKLICSKEAYKAKCLERWKGLGLKGPRGTWENQLRSHFWGERD
jgi:acetyltransferase-like isoleucine patch superfamily enzyme